MSTDPAANPEAWAGERVTRWLRLIEERNRELAPVTEVLFVAAALAEGERVLDVGCGDGPTTRLAAAQVGESGSVIGLDVSSEMLAAAATVEPEPGSAPIDWIEADVAAWTPPADIFDVVLSRFGVMFFDDAAAAFSNMATATRPGGRLVVAVWGLRPESELFDLPLSIAADVLRASGHDVTLPPVDVGPFSLGSVELAARTLAGTGWENVTWTPHDLPLSFAGGVGPHEAAQGCLDFGPTRPLLAQHDDATRDAVAGAIAESFANRLDENGHVVLDSRVGIVTATRG